MASQPAARMPRLDVLQALTDQRFLAVLADSADPLSRAEIAEASGISKPAISEAAIRLSERGVISDAGPRAGRRGRVATLYRLNPSRGYSIGLALQATEAAIEATDLAGDVVFEHRVGIDPGDTPTAVVERVNALLRDCAAMTTAPLLAAAVSVADPVDPRTKAVIRLKDSPFPSGHFDPAVELDWPTDTTVAVDNDVNWATLAELWNGRNARASRRAESSSAASESPESESPESDDFVYVYFGTGIGAGILSHGELHRGASGLAGELGYSRTSGGRDLTHTLADLGLGSAGRYGLDLDRARTAFAATPLAAETIAALDAIALAIVNLAVVLDPAKIVLGGPLTDSAVFVSELTARIASSTLSETPVESAALGEAAPLRGAAAAARKAMLAGLDIPDLSRRFAPE